MTIEMTPIGVFHTEATDIPRHWSVSEVVGQIEINEMYARSPGDVMKLVKRRTVRRINGEVKLVMPRK